MNALKKQLRTARTLLITSLGSLMLASIATAGVKSTIVTGEPQADGVVKLQIKSTNTGIKLDVSANILDSDTKEQKATKIKNAIVTTLNGAGPLKKNLWTAAVSGNEVVISQVGGGGMSVTILKDTTKEENKLKVEPGGGNSEHGFWKWVRSWFVSSSASVVPSGQTLTISADTPTGYWTEVIVTDGTKTVAEIQADLTALAAAHGYSFTSDVISGPDGDRVELTSSGVPFWTGTLDPGKFQVETSASWTEFMGTTGVALELQDVGVGFCFGDGSGMPCPCGNNGIPGHGCANSGGPGARLFADGLTSVSFDSVQLIAEQLPPNKPSLFFQGQNPLNGGNGAPFGDGLRCVGGGIQRLEVVISNGGGQAVSTVPVAAAGGVLPGSQGFYQSWYRDPANGPCGTGFNVSNGYVIEWFQ